MYARLACSTTQKKESNSSHSVIYVWKDLNQAGKIVASMRWIVCVFPAHSPYKYMPALSSRIHRQLTCTMSVELKKLLFSLNADINPLFAIPMALFSTRVRWSHRVTDIVSLWRRTLRSFTRSRFLEQLLNNTPTLCLPKSIRPRRSFFPRCFSLYNNVQPTYHSRCMT